MARADREGGRRAARRQAGILLYQHDVTGLPFEELEANLERDGAPLERNILRVAVHELLDWADIPAPVSINEAVDLAKRYCQTEAAGLVNGILGRIVSEQSEVPH